MYVIDIMWAIFYVLFPFDSCTCANSLAPMTGTGLVASSVAEYWLRCADYLKVSDTSNDMKNCNILTIL